MPRRPNQTSFKRGGTPWNKGRVLARRPLAERLWSRVLKVDGDGCWIWTGATHKTKGHGIIRREWTPSGGSVAYTHVVVYELTHGPIPPGLVVRHKCDNPQCCRPNHLELGTVADNNRDMVERGRHWAQKRRSAA